ncbi:hypothetical protein VOLCADRAFT_80184 [Volvox carteri f. nagariensis]|uniref:SBP-type domain-containing protein n=1 Tax=Volvox carteri f. nagariensis TaxID=3068 RepID=D8TPT6_VOLCA|nr:uncharacterized protein VOLCADRAFT_80184 [Volvox carteri f. nagariensis]EFJ50415.1 hypothetical protein VOLCADRAFT_80184 [Volvox carteri f. nagariensis]|eukprot:XP_002948540.1 hypothetical protein VOLCADRAFT_80184 [Volvox carteri f. nagariensis]
MFAAPKETPNVACCQALKRRKVDNTAAAQGQPQQQAQQGACCQGPSGSIRAGGQPPAAAAACCSFTPNQTQAMQQLTGPLQAAMNSLAPQKAVVETCAVSSMCHGPGAMVPPAAVPAAAPVAATGPQMLNVNMGMALPAGMGWAGLGDMSSPAASAAAAAMAAAVDMPGFFTSMTGGTGRPLAGMGWGIQPMALQMPSMPMQPFPGSHAQCAPALSMPASGFPTPSGVFQQQASMALPPSSVPSPALGSSGETSSLQGSADNAKALCCSGNRGGGGPTCSGGRQQADSSNKASMPLPNKAHQTGATGGRGADGAMVGGDLSDFAISDSEDEDEVGRRGPLGNNRGNGAHHQQHQYLGDVIALHDVGDDNGLMVCQVPGCGKDLSGLKEYHQRYRICDVHIKLQQVMKDGRLQRFCQQCGRFHELTAFDGNRKSCRDQLSKHNARRRRRAQAEQAKGKSAAVDPFAVGAVGCGAAAAANGGATASFDGDVGKLLTCLMQNPSQLHALRLLLGVPTHPALPASHPAPGLGLGVGLGSGSPADSSSDGSDQARTYALARDIMGARNEFAPAFESEHRLIRLSMKLFNRTPADLPSDLRNQVNSWLASAPAGMEASIRPGCVFLTVQMLVDEAGEAQAMAPGALGSLAQHLLTRTGCPFWHTGMYTLQLHEDIMLVRDGRVSCDAASANGDGRFPVIRRLGPLAAVAGQPVTLKLHGQHLDAPNCLVIVRWGAQHLKAHMQPLSAHRAIVRLPPLPELCGPVWVELMRGAYLSPAKQMLVARNEALVEEINKLDVRYGPLSQETVELMLQDMAIVLQHIAGEQGAGAQLPHAAIALKARRLLAIACDMGWAAVASAVLPLACARCSCASEMVAAIHAASVPSSASSASSSSGDKRGLTLLHRAVRSGSIPLLAGMLAWGDSHGYRWRVDAAGPAGITPLHLSAMLDDARVGLLLLDHCGWPAAFTHLKSDNGVTPFHLAFQMGHYQVDSLMAILGGLHQIDQHAGANNAVGAGAQPAGRRSRCGANAAAMVMGCKAEENEDVKPALRGHGHNNTATAAKNGCCAELDPCEMCHCTLPPLLLSIMASCNECGRRRMCMEAECTGAADRCGGCCCGTARPTLRSDSGEVCSSRQHSTVFSITALCQGCHGNRILAVA